MQRCKGVGERESDDRSLSIILTTGWFGLFTRTEVRFVMAMMDWGGEFSGRRAQMCDTFTMMAIGS
jgi:hypothetical protein